ncbi:MAG: amino acid permease, partial [bacterium]|nr:amino acid permease [bacterium]
MPNDTENGLARSLGLFSITNIVIANMIGAGIFTTSGLLMSDLNNPILLISLWVIGGILAVCGALCYGELGAAYPHAGGEYVFLSRLFHPVNGFLSGWVSFFVGFSAPIAASALGFSEY